MASDDDGRSVLTGSVPLEYRTTDRVVVLNLPGQPQCQFKLRLAASPAIPTGSGPGIWPTASRVPGEPARKPAPSRTTPLRSGIACSEWPGFRGAKSGPLESFMISTTDDRIIGPEGIAACPNFA